MKTKPKKLIKKEIIKYLHLDFNIEHLKRGEYSIPYIESKLTTEAEIALSSISFNYMSINGKDRFALINVKVDKISNILRDNISLYIFYLDRQMTIRSKPRQNTIVIEF